MAQLVSDNFTRANENPLSDGGNWGSAPGSGYINFQVLSDFLTGTATSSTEGLQLYTGTSAPNDQYSEVTVGSNATGNYCGATVRVNTSTGVGYVGYIYGAGGSSFIAKLTGSGSITVIKTGPTGLTLHTGDVIRCAVVGSTISLYQNGALLTSVSDSTYTSGQFGLWGVESVDATAVYTLWAGGSADLATPTFSPVAGSYTGTQSVTISSTDSGLSGFAMYYTTDGTTPTTGSTQYTGAISVSASETIKVLCVAAGYANSSITSAVYTITPAPSGGQTGLQLAMDASLRNSGIRH